MRFQFLDQDLYIPEGTLVLLALLALVGWALWLIAKEGWGDDE